MQSTITTTVVIALPLTLLTACANPEVVQVSPGTYVLARADHGGIFGNKDALKSGVIRDSTAFANQRGKVAIPLYAKEHPVGVMGDWASYELTFKLVDPDAPDARENWVLVRSESAAVGGVTSLGSKDTFYVARTASDLTDSAQGTAQSAQDTSKVSDRLAELKELLDTKQISDAEYDKKRREILKGL